MARSRRSYHHGDLPAAVLDAVDEIVREHGVGEVSIREVARRVGVSNAAPSHHFGDKAGLLTAYATRGYRRLAARLQAQAEGPLLGLGEAYVVFATQEPGHFAVMFRPELVNGDDEQLCEASDAAFDVLAAGVRALRPDDDARTVELAAAGAWSIVHGFATLWLNGSFSRTVTSVPPAEAASRVLREFVATAVRSMA